MEDIFRFQGSGEENETAFIKSDFTRRLHRFLSRISHLHISRPLVKFLSFPTHRIIYDRVSLLGYWSPWGDQMTS